MGGKLTSSLAGIAEHIFAKWIDRYHPVFLGVSEAAGEWLKHFGLESKGTVYNSVDYQEIESYCVLKKDYKESKTVFYAGRLIKEKGIYEIIKAYEQLEQKEKVQLILAGDGPMVKELESKELSGNIELAGKLTHEEVMALLNQTDIFIHTSSFAEGMPTSILEAGLMKCAVIATPAGGTAEVCRRETKGRREFTKTSKRNVYMENNSKSN